MEALRGGIGVLFRRSCRLLRLPAITATPWAGSESDAQQGFDGATLIHGAIAFGDVGKW